MCWTVEWVDFAGGAIVGPPKWVIVEIHQSVNNQLIRCKIRKDKEIN